LGKLKLALALLCVLILGITLGAVVQQYIISPPVTVSVEEYTLTLVVNASTCVVGDILRFNGTLATNGFVYEGANVTLWCDNTYTGNSSLTDSDGYYEIFYNATSVGTFEFYTNATVT
jgi:hypothetical protein